MAEFRVLPSLNTHLAETNALYVNPVDATTPYVKMGHFVYKCIPHPLFFKFAVENLSLWSYLFLAKLAPYTMLF